uniref:Probable cytochrome P450 CYP44 isoform X2 n=1 Tax=Crassostrea virginica TaxID=6565 RepID=A0A8B8EDW5_CRAVI|nr:probable cytochrome P450 CYP44 isoform X2 [Crassostrea virginica]
MTCPAKTKRLFIFTRIFNTTERKYSLNEGVRINDKGKECLAFNFDPKETKSFDKVPGPTGIHAIPFVGTTLHFKPFGNTKPRGLNDILRMFQQQYGDLFRFRFAFSWIMVVSNPDLAKEVLSIRVKYPFRPEVDIVKVFGIRNNQEEGLGTLQGEAWWNLRKPAQDHIMKPSAVRSYIPILSEVANDFVASLKDTPVIEDCLKSLITVSTECVGMLCFNRRLGCLENQSPISTSDLNTIFTSTAEAGRIFKPYKYFRTPFYRRFEKAVLKLHRITDQEIESAVQRLEDQTCPINTGEHSLSSEPNLLLAMMSDGRLTKSKTNMLVTNLFGGGIESTSNTMTFLWYELAANPEKQEKVYHEITTQKSLSQLDKTPLSKMTFLKACLRESMRKNFPINVGNIRVFDKDCQLSGYHIPKETRILIASNNISQDSRFYKDPGKFIPERFLRGDNSLDEETRHSHPFAFLPFGFGPRSCIGQRFAETEILVLTLKLIEKFRISLPPGSPKNLESVTRTFTAPARKVTLHLTPRVPKS